MGKLTMRKSCPTGKTRETKISPKGIKRMSISFAKGKMNMTKSCPNGKTTTSKSRPRGKMTSATSGTTPQPWWMMRTLIWVPRRCPDVPAVWLQRQQKRQSVTCTAHLLPQQVSQTPSWQLLPWLEVLRKRSSQGGKGSSFFCLWQADDSSRGREPGCCPAQPLLPTQPLVSPAGNPSPQQEVGSLQEMALPLQAGALGSAWAVSVVLHGGMARGLVPPTASTRQVPRDGTLREQHMVGLLWAC